MEDLIKNDATFELFANSEGGRLLDNRVLLSYPSERSSFQVDLGEGGDYSYFAPEDEPVKPKKERPSYDPDKVAGAISSGASALGSVVTTVQAFKGDGTKAPSRRKALKEVCGRRPILKKKREGTYDKCVADYTAGKIGNVVNTSPTGNRTPETTLPEETPPNNNKKIIIGAVVVVALVVTAFIGYKKGWFGKKSVAK
jgi:hypothetical protein